MPTELGRLDPKTDLRFELYNDPAWMAVVDPSRYDADLLDWDLDSLHRKMVDAMNREALVAWGTPERNLRVRITMGASSSPSLASCSGHLHVTGPLVVASYGAITMAAQFAEARLDTEAEFSFDLAPGRFQVEVLRYFEHEDGAQDSGLTADPRQEDYELVFTPSERPALRRDSVPWWA